MEQSSTADRNKKLIAVAVIVLVIGLIYIIRAQADDAETASTRSASTAQQETTGSSGDRAASAGATASGTTAYKDGTYTASGSYRTPQSTETVQVTLTVAGDTVTAAEFSAEPETSQSAEYQSAFRSGYKSQVVGKKLSDIDLTRVSGSSLTPIGFNAAVDDIQDQAKA